MIVNKVKYTNTSKPKVWQIGDLVDYIRNPTKTNADEKVAHAGSRNFLTSTHIGQKCEMILLAEESVHSKMPVSHWVYSWKMYIIALLYPSTSIYRLITVYSRFLTSSYIPENPLTYPLNKGLLGVSIFYLGVYTNWR